MSFPGAMESSWFPTLRGVFAGVGLIGAAIAATGPAPRPPTGTEAPVEMAPFSVDATRDVGFAATEKCRRPF